METHVRCCWRCALLVTVTLGVWVGVAHGAALHGTVPNAENLQVPVTRPVEPLDWLEAVAVTLDKGGNAVVPAGASLGGARELPDLITCPPGYSKVYSNTSPLDPPRIAGGLPAGTYFADDCQLAGTDRMVGYYSVATLLKVGDPPFNVQMDLARDIDGTDVDYIAGSQCIVLNDTEDLPTTQICDITATPVGVPDTVYVVVEFDQDDAFWIIAEDTRDPGDIGHTGSNVCIGGLSPPGCDWHYGRYLYSDIIVIPGCDWSSDLHAGNWTELCALEGGGPGAGACCKGVCELTSTDCYDSYDCSLGVCDSGVFAGQPCAFNNDCYYCNDAPQDHCGGLSADCPQGGGCNMGPQCFGAEACVYDCHDTTYDDCTGAGNRWGGAGTQCIDIAWEPPCDQGVCCRTAGGCYHGRLEANCHATDFAFDWKPGLLCEPYGPCNEGSCCYPDGSCADSDAGCDGCDGDGSISEYECVVVMNGEFAEYSGGHSSCATADCPPPCSLTCVNNEAEPCDDSGDGRLNDGCNLATPVFGTITCNGPSVCGTVWASGGSRDTDWYAIEGLDAVDADSDGFVSVTVNVNAQSPNGLAVRAMLLSDDGNCGDLDILANGTDPCAIAWSENCGPVPDVDTDGSDEPISYTVCLDLSISRYIVHVALANPIGGVYDDLPCGTGGGVKYEVTMTCSDPCTIPCCGLDKSCTLVTSPDLCTGLGTCPDPGCWTNCEEAECPVLCDLSNCVGGGGTPENEPDCEGVNDGCSADWPDPGQVSLIAVDETVCGTCQAVYSGRCHSGEHFILHDVDWYKFEVTAEMGTVALLWTVTAEFAPTVSIYDSNGETCSGRTLLTEISGGRCETVTAYACITEPDVYWLVVGPDIDQDLDDDVFDCGAPLAGHYEATLTLGCCTDITCEVGDLLEGEPTCSNDYDDQFNGGCSGDAPYEFSTNLIPDGDPVCGESGTFDIGTSGTFRDTDWYSRYLVEDQLLRMDVQAGFPVAASIWYDPDHDCGPNLTLVAYQTDYDCELMQLYYFIPLSEGGYYYFMVTPLFFTGVPCGQHYEVSLTNVEDPPRWNDCAFAVPVTAGTLEQPQAYPFYTNAAVTTDGPSHTGAECGIEEDDAFQTDIWYVFTAQERGTLKVDTCSKETRFNTMLAVYDTGTCIPTAEDLMACNDDGTAPCGKYKNGSAVTVNVEADHSYLIRVGGYFGAKGTGVLKVGHEADIEILSTDTCAIHDWGGSNPEEMCCDFDVEMRYGGVRKLILTLDRAAPDSCEASISCTPYAYPFTPTCTSQSPEPNQVTIEFDPQIPDQNCCELSVHRLYPNQWIGALIGDCNEDGDVNSMDYSCVKLRLGCDVAADCECARADINADGDVNSMDYSSIKLRLGHVIPEPCAP